MAWYETIYSTIESYCWVLFLKDFPREDAAASGEDEVGPIELEHILSYTHTLTWVSSSWMSD
jgi:hypothetical protein